ncbi:MAG: hypothetical protein HQ567_30650 [Candidatus Nealsonbacteria bacterium]|nr:hypothetical protein [Candidatus Nealsonbacteria bacterium]
MSRNTCVQIILRKITATASFFLLVGFVPASNIWAETTSDAEVEAPQAETPVAETPETETPVAETAEAEQEATSSATAHQQIAQQRANAMARLHNLSHSIQNCRGSDCPGFPSSVFEGIGMSTGGTPGTCNNGGRVLADAMAVSSSGTVYRVRFFTTNGGFNGHRGWGRRGRRG